eukprot:gnl/MRDRNA2_/MRDRNA2_79830_c0_seq1.p1 gnl/MRDRNA2_/MRDRNA2_79830_c0~~gnl/MRDRNA2_/MRDRNA2_79830_c0_seq1.p1  ORF type:complete len:325 (-),score=86.63 gnl/MRDRNA2_/MRDRNA2_79830_c0_seq1:534-1508(-)
MAHRGREQRGDLRKELSGLVSEVFRRSGGAGAKAAATTEKTADKQKWQRWKKGEQQTKLSRKKLRKEHRDQKKQNRAHFFEGRNKQRDESHLTDSKVSKHVLNSEKKSKHKQVLESPPADKTALSKKKRKATGAAEVNKEALSSKKRKVTTAKRKSTAVHHETGTEGSETEVNQQNQRLQEEKPKQSSYVPPHLRRAREEKDPSADLRRELRGLLNRVTEGNLDLTGNQLCQLLQQLLALVGGTKAADVFVDVMLPAAVGDANGSPLIVGCHAALISCVHVHLGGLGFAGRALCRAGDELLKRLQSQRFRRSQLVKIVESPRTV